MATNPYYPFQQFLNRNKDQNKGYAQPNSSTDNIVNTVSGASNTPPPANPEESAPIASQAQYTPYGTAPGEYHSGYTPGARHNRGGGSAQVGVQTGSSTKPIPNTQVGGSISVPKPRGEQPNTTPPARTYTSPTGPTTTTPSSVLGATAPGAEAHNAGTLGLKMLGSYGDNRFDQILRDYNQNMGLLKIAEDQTGVKNGRELMERKEKIENAYFDGNQDPESISQATGIPLDKVEQFFRGEMFKDAEMEDRVSEDYRKEFEFQTQDMVRGKNRAIQDLDIRENRTREQYNRQVDDIIESAGLGIASSRKMGALTGQIQSSGYVEAINMMRDNANKNLDRLKTEFNRDNDDITLARTRLLEDFETNSTKMKYYFDKGMDDLRSNGISRVMDIQAKYGVATRDAVQALDGLYNELETSKMNHLNEYMSMQTSYNNKRSSEIQALKDYAIDMEKLGWSREKYQTEQRQAQLDQYQAYQEAYGTTVANQMFPEMAGQFNQASFNGKGLGVDLSKFGELRSQYKNQARTKSNNPIGFSMNASFEKYFSTGTAPAGSTAELRAKNGINFERGGSRAEGGDYIKFATLEDGMKASRLWRENKNSTIDQQLKSFATDQYTLAGFEGKKFSDLSPSEQDQFLLAQIKHESPGLHELLTTSNGYIEQSQITGPRQITDNHFDEVTKYSQELRGTEKLQCGQFANDYRRLHTGSKAGIGDDYASKLSAVKKQGQSDVPIEGGLFIQDIGKYGHVGVVKQVHDDGSITVMEANRVENSSSGGVPRIDTYTAEEVAKMQFSQAPKNLPGSVMTDGSFGGASEEAVKQAQAIMSPGSSIKLSELPSAMRAEVGPILTQMQQEAKANGDTVGYMRASAGGDKPEQAFVQSLTKAFTVISQLDTLKSKISEKNPSFTDSETGEALDISPLTGWLRKKNPRDSNAQEISALLTSMTPMLARGIYGEVGVLTDNDIRLYQQTIPNLNQTDDVKLAVLGLTLRTVRNGIKDSIEINAGSGRNVSGLADKYEAFEKKIADIEKELGIGQEQEQEQPQSPEEDPRYDPYDSIIDDPYGEFLGE